MIAIDFGTSRTKVAYLHNAKVTLAAIGEQGNKFIPSIFHIDSEGEVLFGDDAKYEIADDPKGIVDTLKRKLRDRRIRKNRQSKKDNRKYRSLF